MTREAVRTGVPIAALPPAAIGTARPAMGIARLGDGKSWRGRAPAGCALNARLGDIIVLADKGEPNPGVDILLMSGADEVDILSMEAEEEARLPPDFASSGFAGLGLGGASTSSSGATDMLNRLGELEMVIL